MDLFASCVGGKEDLVIILGLIAMQLLYGSFSVFMSRVLSMGLNPQFVVIFGSLLAAIVLSPVAFFLEKVTVFQSLLFLGMHKTSSATASAMVNLSSALVFLIAWFIGLEMVDVRSRRSWAKIVGTLVCLGGAVTIAFRWGPPLVTSESRKDEMIIGCMYLLVAVFAQSCSIILQAATLMHFPAPLSLCAINFWLGSVFTAVVHVVQGRGFDMGWSELSVAALFGVAVMGGFVDGICFSFKAWSIKKKGPVIVSIFHPLSTIWAAILSFFLLGDSLRWGSVIGMVIVFIGLYLVLWGKSKDRYALPLEANNEADVLEQQEQRKPLLV
ncbi:WAT1-related protein At5g47470-like isoform X2 [Nymphaea colorata]|uniref:WAT1-related protein At5g47470-like isoform X2 n=1 Tax=Nymphaea colorata TaxID=210225 RepID=UPI00129DDB67|nr:WAT1-related protein At5g47470-like isoform X2 [Nymphaea colorata]